MDQTYLATKAIANSANLLHAESITNVLECGLDDGVDIIRLVLREPCTYINIARVHVADVDLVTLEKIRDDGQVAIVGELVGEELGVAENTEDVGQEDNSLIGVLVVLGGGNVGVDCT